MGRKATSRPAKPRNQQAQASLVQMVSTSSAPLPQDDSSLLQANSQTVPQIFTAGIDEAGRGCLAGPVVAAAVILPECYDLPGLNDSKAWCDAAKVPLYFTGRDGAVRIIWPARGDSLGPPAVHSARP